MAMPGQKFETKQRITVRNLRIREDTAKVCVMFSLLSFVRFIAARVKITRVLRAGQPLIMSTAMHTS